MSGGDHRQRHGDDNDLTADQLLLIVVDGFGDDTGNYAVNINYQ